MIARGEATNELYMTEDIQIMYRGNAGEIHQDAILAAAKKAREALSAKDFPEGNWGGVEHGLQLSLRLARPDFTNGEPIFATLLLRNTTTSNMNSFMYPPYTEFCDGPADFNIASASGEVPPSHAPLIPGVMPGLHDAPNSKVQHKILEHVDSGYHLTNGAYTIQAVIKVIYPGSNHWEHVEVKSAKVPVEIK